ncbi:MAG TPA: energy transducer TonB [Candidatus Dormibacteraeota bacterium]|nr:energy transducer TonB [Candidatus Dormibacteraeota bacterium]
MGSAPNTPESPGKHEFRTQWLRSNQPEARRGLFWSNLHDFLYERPVKGAPKGTYLHPVEYGTGFLDNLKEWFRPGVRASGDSTLLIEPRPWYRSFPDNVRESIRLARMGPVKLERPVEVGELWNPPRKYRRTQLLVFLAHVLVALLILVPFFPRVARPLVQATSNLVPLDFSPYLPPTAKHGKKLSGGGGGGVRSPVPATRGRLPRFSRTQFAPPMAKIIPHPLIPVEATVLGPPQVKLPSPNLPNYGDPLAKLITNSGGSGNGGGIGTGSSGGIGSGQGGGVGPGYEYGAGGGYPTAGESGYGEPTCLYCPNPTFSDEAVKVKYQGTVLLRFVVTASGTTKNIQIVRSLGLGLDQKAIAAVRAWKFKPALGPNGKPATVIMMAEISFRLL